MWQSVPIKSLHRGGTAHFRSLGIVEGVERCVRYREDYCQDQIQQHQKEEEEEEEVVVVVEEGTSLLQRWA